MILSSVNTRCSALKAWFTLPSPTKTVLAKNLLCAMFEIWIAHDNTLTLLTTEARGRQESCIFTMVVSDVLVWTKIIDLFSYLVTILPTNEFLFLLFSNTIAPFHYLLTVDCFITRQFPTDMFTYLYLFFSISALHYNSKQTLKIWQMWGQMKKIFVGT